MKSFEELYREIQSSETLKEKFIAAAKESRLVAFLKEHDCDASVKDVMDFIKGVKERSLSDNDLEKVAGGCSSTETFGCSTLECRPTV